MQAVCGRISHIVTLSFFFFVASDDLYEFFRKIIFSNKLSEFHLLWHTVELVMSTRLCLL